MSRDYWLGLATLPAIALLIALACLAAYSLGPATRYRVEPCRFCTALGWKDPVYYNADHDHVSRLSLWFRERYHRWFIMPRRAHRTEWQEWADSRRSDSHRAQLEKVRHKFGIRAR